MLEIVQQSKRIAEAANDLAAVLSDGAFQITREVTFPGYGPEGPTVIYCPKGTRLWSGHKKSKKAFMFWFGIGLDKPEPWTPSIEINFPMVFDRLRKGRFLKDQSGQLWLGHRGSLGGGRASVSMKEFDKLIEGFSREDALLSHAGGKTEALYAFGPITENGFLTTLERYVEQAERIREIKRQEIARSKANSER